MSALEALSIETELSPAFSVIEPLVPRVPLVFDSPHSGTIYPKRFLQSSQLDARTLRKSEDSFVEELFAHVVDHGAAFVHAHFPRAYLDVNREPYELDPKLFTEKLPDHANTQSLRVAAGLGTIARVVSETEAIYTEPLLLSDALVRIALLHVPYHNALTRLSTQLRQRFGISVLVNCHSMPSFPMPNPEDIRPDVVLGDRYGTSCAPELTLFVKRMMQDMGYRVALNKPYAGGYITERYGQPENGLHALQIELNRGLYMDEVRFTQTSGFVQLQQDLIRLTQNLVAELPSLIRRPSLAAE